MNKFSTELLIVAAAIVIFYLRIAMLRGQKKRFEREFALKRRKIKGRSKGSPLPKQAPGSPPFGISSWVLVGVAILLMLIGLVAYNKFMFLGWEIVKDPQWVDTYAKYWHWLVSAGVVMFAFCFKINKPIEEE
jgi:multisubunit Na+/H+ antiporter MnhB subunit